MQHLQQRSIHRRGVLRRQNGFSPTVNWDQPTDTAVVNTNPASPASSNTPASTPTPAGGQASGQNSQSQSSANSPTSPTASNPANPTTSATPAAPATTAPTTTAAAANTNTSTTGPATTPTQSSATSTPSTPTTTSAANNQANANTSPTSAGKNTILSPSALTGATVTQTFTSIGAGAASVSPSSTGAASTSSSVNTGAVVGGIIAGIVGLAGIIFAVTFFIRRSRHNDDDGDFSDDALRRQSAVLPDDTFSPTRGMPDRSYGATPRPPSMFEQRMGNVPASFGAPPPQATGYYGYQAPQSFNPGEFMPNNGPYTQDPMTPNSTNPFFAPMGQTPLGSPVSVGPYGSAYDEQGQLLNRQPSAGANAYLSRQPSSGAAAVLSRQPSAGAGVMLSRQPSMGNALETPSDAHYVDLNRSSVSPFQAQQYEEISRRLNTNAPVPLPPAVGNGATEYAEKEGMSPKLNNTVPLDVGQSVNPGQLLSVAPKEQALPESPFADPGIHETEEALPQPPSPTFSAKARIASNPPILPEIQLQQRAFSPVTMEFPGGVSAARPVPSPLSTSVALPSAPADVHIANAHIASAPQGVSNNAAAQKEFKRPETMYDDDDAYGGI
ncbi:hypothetical protein ABKN59_006707 [Abortiporus biennis]